MRLKTVLMQIPRTRATNVLTMYCHLHPQRWFLDERLLRTERPFEPAFVVFWVHRMRWPLGLSAWHVHNPHDIWLCITHAQYGGRLLVQGKRPAKYAIS